jgi:hypothetical protein
LWFGTSAILSFNLDFFLFSKFLVFNLFMSKSQEKSLSLLQHLEFEIKEKAPAAEFVFFKCDCTSSLTMLCTILVSCWNSWNDWSKGGRWKCSVKSVAIRKAATWAFLIPS